MSTLLFALLAQLNPAVASPPIDTGAACADPVQLEPAAMLGKLSRLQRVCLEYAMLADNPQDFRKRASLLLMSDASARGLDATWATLAEHHLADIDGSDPSLMLNYAKHLARHDSHRERALYWTERSLDRMTDWTGAARQLHRDKALALLVTLETRNANDAAMRWVDSDRVEDEDAQRRAMQMARMSALQWCEHRGAYRMSLRPAVDAYVGSGGDPEACVSAAWSAAHSGSQPPDGDYDDWEWDR